MRTTIDLTAEAYHVAKALARERNLSLGKVVSELILHPTSPQTSGKERRRYSAAGFPVFSTGKKITSEDVRALLEDE